MRRWGIVLVVVSVLAGMTTNAAGTPRSPRPPRAPRTGNGFVDADLARARQDDYLAFATAQDLEPTAVLNVLAHAERARRDRSCDVDAERVGPEAFADSFRKLDGFEDTADFDLLYLMNLWYGYRRVLRDDLVDAIEARILGFKYWYDEPTPEGVVDQRWYWSENHRIIFHTLELLAGQAFPRERFADGRSGREHYAHAEALIEEWITEKARCGFSELHSDVYYEKDVTPLLTLVEFAEDDELAEQAAMVLDLVLFDVALHLQRGNLGASHGRSYMKDKSTALDQDVFGLAKLLFDDTDGPYQSINGAWTALLARARRYRLPEVIRRVAASEATTVDRERMNVPLDPLAPVEADPEAPYGYDFDDPANVPFWWERGALTAWQAVPLTLATLDRYGFWESDFFQPFLPFRDAVGGDTAAAQALAQSLAPMLAFGLLSEVNSYTWRSPDVMLSTAQSYRPGVFGEQYHAWQATLDESALVFTTHPRNEPQVGTEWPDSDGYWTGSGSMPRSAQQGSAAIHQYAPQFADPGPDGLLGQFDYLDMTHAYFPQEHFDEVVSDGHWTLGRKGDGYVALWSWRPTRWRDHDPAEVFTNGLTSRFDLVAEGGADNVWVTEVGNAERYGSFEAFRAAVTATAVDVVDRGTTNGLPGGFDVRYRSPGEGVLELGWDTPLRIDGEEVALDGYPRYDNPWATVPFDSLRYELRDGDVSLTLDFESGTRDADGPRRRRRPRR
ncbi:hypothetical protein BH18ACT1_BH18ACT1_13220 [soil metagenome]